MLGSSNACTAWVAAAAVLLLLYTIAAHHLGTRDRGEGGWAGREQRVGGLRLVHRGEELAILVAEVEAEQPVVDRAREEVEDRRRELLRSALARRDAGGKQPVQRAPHHRVRFDAALQGRLVGHVLGHRVAKGSVVAAVHRAVARRERERHDRQPGRVERQRLEDEVVHPEVRAAVLRPDHQLLQGGGEVALATARRAPRCERDMRAAPGAARAGRRSRACRRT